MAKFRVRAYKVTIRIRTATLKATCAIRPGANRVNQQYMSISVWNLVVNFWPAAGARATNLPPSFAMSSGVALVKARSSFYQTCIFGINRLRWKGEAVGGRVSSFGGSAIIVDHASTLIGWIDPFRYWPLEVFQYPRTANTMLIHLVTNVDTQQKQRQFHAKLLTRSTDRRVFCAQLSYNGACSYDYFTHIKRLIVGVLPSVVNLSKQNQWRPLLEIEFDKRTLHFLMSAWNSILIRLVHQSTCFWLLSKVAQVFEAQAPLSSSCVAFELLTRLIVASYLVITTRT